jgi:glycosyltransferase involved in cell wall biosynthesis
LSDSRVSGPPDGSARSPLVSVVLPIHNQADHLERMVEQYVEALTASGIGHELILVPNGCSDSSPALAEDLSRRLGSVRSVAVAKPGWGGAVRAGISSARGDLVAYTNSARTSAGDLVNTITFALNNPGVVIKVNRRIRDSLVRRAGSLLFNLQCRVLFQLACWDVNGTPKVFPRCRSRLLQLTRDDDLVDLEFNVIVRDEGYPVLEVPIFSTARHGGRSTTTVRGAMKIYWGALGFWRAHRRP